MQEKSRGSVSINSADPLAPPVVDDGLLSDSSDLDLYIAGFQTYIKNISIALSAIDPQYQLVIPDPAILDNTDLLTDFIRKEVDANQHYQCHCKMAPLDQGGVVDSTGHVHGVEHLIIADNSINPTVQDGSPQQTGFLVPTRSRGFCSENKDESLFLNSACEDTRTHIRNSACEDTRTHIKVIKHMQLMWLRVSSHAVRRNSESCE